MWWDYSLSLIVVSCHTREVQELSGAGTWVFLLFLFVDEILWPIDHLDNGTECTLKSFAYDAKWGRVADTLESMARH